LRWAAGSQSEGLYTSYDKTDDDRLTGNFAIASIPLPVYYQTNVGVASGVPVSPPMGNKADNTRELNNTTAGALQGVRKNFVDSRNVYIGGSGTVVGQFYNGIGDDGYDYRLKYSNGDTATLFMTPPSGNVTGSVNFSFSGNTWQETQSNSNPARYMIIVVKALQVPNGGSGTGANTNQRNYSGPTTYANSQYRYILPPMYHFTFSYVLGGYNPNVNIS